MDKKSRKELKKQYKNSHKDPDIENLKENMRRIENSVYKNGLSDAEIGHIIQKYNGAFNGRK